MTVGGILANTAPTQESARDGDIRTLSAPNLDDGDPAEDVDRGGGAGDRGDGGGRAGGRRALADGDAGAGHGAAVADRRQLRERRLRFSARGGHGGAAGTDECN